MTDFTAHAHPVLAVACPDCRVPAGRWCRRPSGHRASVLHAARGQAADREFIARHGAAATILRTPDGWRIKGDRTVPPR